MESQVPGQPSAQRTAQKSAQNRHCSDRRTPGAARTGGLDEAAFYERRKVALDRSVVQSLVQQHIPGQGVRLTTLEVDADRVHLRLGRPMDLPLVPPGWRSRTVVVADADAWLRR